MEQPRASSKLTSNYTDLLFDQAANDEWCEFIAEKIRGIVDDPETAERLIPKDHRFGEKRPPFVDRLLRDVQPTRTSSLVDLRRDADRARDRARDRDGRRRAASSTSSCGRPASTSAPARCCAWGSGVATASRSPTTGPTGPRTFLGIQTAGFPNLFFPGGPHAAAGNNPRYNGDQVDFVTDTLVYAARPRLRHDRGRTPRPRSAGRAWSTGARRSRPFGEISYYFGSNIPGKPRRYLLNSGGRPKLFKEIARVRRTDYEAFRLRPSRPASPASPPLPAGAAGAP